MRWWETTLRVATLSPGGCGTVAALLVLSGCAGVHLQDKAQLATATTAKETYAKAEVDQVILDETKNLKAQLAAELAIVRANYQLRLDYAFLRMADDDDRPMADTWTTRAKGRLDDLGIVADKEAEAANQVRSQSQKLREYLKRQVTLASREGTLRSFADVLFATVGRRPPGCSEDTPEVLPFLNDLPKAQKSLAASVYERYRGSCGKVLTARTNLLALIADESEILFAYQDWQAASQEWLRLRADIANRAAEVAEAKRAYESALAQAGATGEDAEEKITDAASKLTEVLTTATDVGGALGVLPGERIKALTTILLAVASEGAEGQAEEGALKTATLVAGKIPAIAGQIKALEESGRAPSVGALLIELRHQSILLDYAKERQALVQQRAALHEERYKAYDEEAGQWLKFHDAFCSYAVLEAGQEHPGADCDAFTVTLETRDGTPTAICVVTNPEAPSIQNCALTKSWKATLGSLPSDKAAKREFYKALAAFSRAMEARAPQDEYEFRLVDLDHQEIVAANRSAVRAWDSLVKVPLDQIEAYHAAGIPPERIAELLVSGLSLGAIAVGVNR